MMNIKAASCGWLWLVLCAVFAGAAAAQAPPPPDFCASIKITPDPLLIPPEGGTFQHTVTTEPNPFCLCRWSSVYRVPFGRAVGYPDDLTDFPVLRGERAKEPAACVFDFTRVYEPNNGPRRTGIFGVWANDRTGPIDFSTATATIEIIQETGNFIRITAALPEKETPLEPNEIRGFQASVAYNLATKDEGEIVLNLFDAEGGPLAFSEPLAVQKGAGEVGLAIGIAQLPEEGPVLLSAELRDETGMKLVQSQEVIYTLIRSHVEVTQVIQNSSNTVPLVAGKRTVARVYVTAVGDRGGSEVQAELEGFRNGQSLGILSGSATVLESEEGVPKLGTRSQLNMSANLALPPSWVQPGGLELRTAGLEEPVSVEFQQRRVLRVGYMEFCLVSSDIELEDCPSSDISGADTFARKIFPVDELAYLWLPVRIGGLPSFVRLLMVSAAVIEEGLADIVVVWATTTILGHGSFARFKIAHDVGGAESEINLARALAGSVLRTQGCRLTVPRIGEVGLDTQGAHGLEIKGFPTDHDFVFECNALRAWVSEASYRTLFGAFGVQGSKTSVMSHWKCRS